MKKLVLAALAISILCCNPAATQQNSCSCDPVPAITYDISTYAPCNGNSDDRPGFDAWQSDVLTWQATHTGLVQLNIPSGAVCRAKTGTPTQRSPFQGIKSLLVAGAGATFTDSGGSDPGWFFGSGAPLQSGGSGLQNDNTHSVRIATVSAGTSSITLLDTSKCGLFNAGDWTLLAGIDPQGFGFPPNPMVFEYIQIQSISSCAGSGTVTLKSSLNKSYESTWPVYNAGNAFGIDQGGPGTLYAISQKWVTTQEYRGLTVSQTGAQTNSNGQNITWHNAIFTGSLCPIPSQNQVYNLTGVTATNCDFEIDKIIDTINFTNVTAHLIDFQSASVHNVNFTNVAATSSVNGSGAVSTGIANSNLTSYAPGPHSFGSGGAISATNSVFGAVVPNSGASQTEINNRGTWAGAVLTVPHNFTVLSAANNGSGLIRLAVDSTAGYSTGLVTDITVTSGSTSCASSGTAPWIVTVVDATHFDLQGSSFIATCVGSGGSLPLNWAVPRANVYFFGKFGTTGPMLQVADLTQDATSTHVTFSNLSGGFPVMQLKTGVKGAATRADIRVHEAPRFSCTGCSGSADALDLNNAGAQNVPLWQYSKRTLNRSNCTPSTPVVPVWGSFVSASVAVSAASTAASLNIQFDPLAGIAVVNSATPGTWNPTVNAKITGTRTMTPTTTSGTQTGDSLIAPGAGAWLVNNQYNPECSAAPGGSDPVTATYEFIANQGVVYP